MWMLLAVVLLIALLQWLLPLGMRPGLCFAVTTPAGFGRSPAGRRALRGYRAGVALSALLALGLLLLAPRADAPLAQAAVLVQVLGGWLAHGLARRQVLPHAIAGDSVREVSLPLPPEGLPGGAALQAGPFALLAVLALGPLAQGAPLAPALLRTLVLALLPCAALTLLSLALLRGARRGAALGRWGSTRRVTLGIMLGASYLVALSGSLSAWALAGGPAWLGRVQAGATLLFVAASVAVGVATLRRRATLPPASDGTPDAHWRWGGILYVNPGDPALWVEKRVGIGYTVNFGHPWAWWVLGLLVGFPLAAHALLALLVVVQQR